MVTIDDVRSELKQVYDPEIPVNILDLGLVYDIVLEGATSAVRWGVAGNIVWAWVLTIPCSAFMAGIAWWIGRQLF
jgi:phosphate/sulfate permease